MLIRNLTVVHEQVLASYKYYISAKSSGWDATAWSITLELNKQDLNHGARIAWTK